MENSKRARRTLLTVEDLPILRVKWDENPEIEEGITGVMDLLPVLRPWREGNHRSGIWPGCHRSAAERIGRRLGPSWRGADAKRRPTIDEAGRAGFVEEI
jgi:hypothetical protein